jgi:hypothetical protein
METATRAAVTRGEEKGKPDLSWQGRGVPACGRAYSGLRLLIKEEAYRSVSYRPIPGGKRCISVCEYRFTYALTIGYRDIWET